MGFGDYIHWTSVIRDMYKYINKGTMEEKLNKINYFKDKFLSEKSKYGIQEFKKEDDNEDFKFFIYITNAKCPLFKQKEGKQIFYNNPYVIKSPSKYPNVIMFVIVSSDYFIVREKRFLDHKHVVDQYCENLGLKEFSIDGDIHFTKEEKEKVNKYIPDNEFVYIEPVNHKPGRSYPFEKYQELVNIFKDKLNFIQISPEKFGVMDNKILDNVISHVGIFTYRETLLYMSHSKFCIVNHGGLSIGNAVTKTKTICVYPAQFNPRMTTFDSEIDIYVASDSHQSCGTMDGNYEAFKKRYPNGCPKCWDLYCKFDNNILIDKVNQLI